MLKQQTKPTVWDDEIVFETFSCVFFFIPVPVDITMVFRQVKLIHCVVEGGQFRVYF